MTSEHMFTVQGIDRDGVPPIYEEFDTLEEAASYARTRNPLNVIVAGWKHEAYLPGEKRRLVSVCLP